MLEHPDRSPDHRTPRARISRRAVLFAAGGVTLLGGCTNPAAPGPAADPTELPPTVPPHQSSPRASSSSASAKGTDPPKQHTAALAVQSAPEYYVHAGSKAIALTLDDGPDSEYTPQILAILAEHGVTATFCVIGCQIAANAGVVHDIVAADHAIANHTWNHADQSTLAYSAVVSQIERTNDALAGLGVHPQIYRAPYGNWSPTVFQACAAQGLRPVDWSVDPRDWSLPGVGAIVSNILQHTHTGSIILDHDGGGDRSQTVAALRIWLPHLLAQGYHFVRV
jgi:peptidoglycan/xylan/chitin deacetylase (PgdA/CDA1 family)